MSFVSIAIFVPAWSFFVANASEESPWPSYSSESFVFLLFIFVFFSEVFGFLVVLVADKSFRSQKPKKSRKTKKNKKTMPLNMVLGLDIPQNPLFFFVFVFFSEVFRFLVTLVADKSFRSQKPKTFEENKKNKKNNAFEQSPWPRHSSESFFCCFFCWFLFEVFGFLVVLVADKSFHGQKQKKPEENQKYQKKPMPQELWHGVQMRGGHLWLGGAHFFNGKNGKNWQNLANKRTIIHVELDIV